MYCDPIQVKVWRNTLQRERKGERGQEIYIKGFPVAIFEKGDCRYFLFASLLFF